MQQFQEGFFKHGAIPGLVLETENTLSQQAKTRTITNWITSYSPKNGARKPMIIDNGLKLKEMYKISFQDMDFDVSIERHDSKILRALGVPDILLAGGNNANINPNLRLFYLETILPIVRKYTSAMERFFGYDLAPITSDVTALQPDLRDVAAYHSTLVNAGILTPNEARDELRYPRITDQDMDKIRVPANIAGSASNPSEGGAPKKDNNDQQN
jgi:HK97 family phage portal protein